MGKKTLHIVSLDIPYPPNRGSVISIFNRIKAFHDAGVDIILHAFYKEFKAPVELTEYCSMIYLYPRKAIWEIENLNIPLYIQSRRSRQLTERLALDDAPVLFEGLHTMYHLNDPSLKRKKKFLVLHNMESSYYRHLAVLEKPGLKKIYYRLESTLSRKFEQKNLCRVDGIFAMSSNETMHLSKIYDKVFWVPPFIDQEVQCPGGKGSYALFHGDLSIKENELGALFLIREVFNDIDLPLTIAGYRPTTSLRHWVATNPKVVLYETPGAQQMKSLIEGAQIILAPFKHATGYKIKLLQSLVLGRHILASTVVHVYSELCPVIHFADTPREWKQKIDQLKDLPVSFEDINRRTQLIQTIFHTKSNVEKILAVLFDEAN